MSADPLLLRLRLYVAGNAPNGLAALSNVKAALQELGRTDDVELEVLDVFDGVERALADGVLVTPLLIRIQPTPPVRVIGSLSDRGHLRMVLDPAGGP